MFWRDKNENLMQLRDPNLVWLQSDETYYTSLAKRQTYTREPHEDFLINFLEKNEK